MMSIKLTLNYKLVGGTTEMRTEIEMISLIKDIAFKEENIRAAYIEGSRTNPNAPKDIFQDYDIVLLWRLNINEFYAE